MPEKSGSEFRVDEEMKGIEKIILRLQMRKSVMLNTNIEDERIVGF